MVGTIPKEGLITLEDLATICNIKNKYLLRKKLELWDVRLKEVEKGKYLIELRSLYRAVTRGEEHIDVGGL